MQALTEEIGALDERLADNSIYSGDSSELNALLAEQGQLRTRLEDIESSWLSRQEQLEEAMKNADTCLLYTSPSPRDLSTSRMPSSA